MNKILRIFISTLFISYAAVPSYAGIEGDAYKASYMCNDLSGKERWRATAEIRHKKGDIYTITEKMSGIYSGFNGKISWVAVTDFERTKDNVKPLNMDQRFFNGKGRPIAISKQEFNYAERIVTCTYEDLVEKTISRKKFVFSKDIINRLLQGVCGQKFIETGLESKEIQVISPEPELYNIKLNRMGEEEIEINGRKRKTYKICFDPMLGLLNFVKIFLPRSLVWHSAEPIYEWLKYEGLECSVSSPTVEIISLDEDTTTSIPVPQSPAP